MIAFQWVGGSAFFAGNMACALEWDLRRALAVTFVEHLVGAM